jgi:hypothetical protein
MGGIFFFWLEREELGQIRTARGLEEVHMAYIEEPQEYAELVRAFLARFRRSQSKSI